MSRQTRFNDSLDRRWYGASSDLVASATDSSFCGVDPIVIAPDKDGCADEHPSKDSSLKYENNSGPKNMQPFQVVDQRFVGRKHASFQSADSNQRETQLARSFNQPNVFLVPSGNPVSSAVITDADALSQKMRQYHTVPAPSGYMPPQSSSGRVYPLQSADCIITSSSIGALGIGSVVPAPVRQFEAATVSLQTLGDMSATLRPSGSSQPQQLQRKVPEPQRPRAVAPHPTSMQSSQSCSSSQGTGLQIDPAQSVVILVRPGGDQSKSSGSRRSLGDADLSCQVFAGSEQLPITDQADRRRDIQGQESTQSLPRCSSYSQDQVQAPVIVKSDVRVKAPLIEDLTRADLNFPSQAFSQANRPPQRSTVNNQVQQQSSEGSQRRQQWAAAVPMGDKNCQPFGSLAAPSTLQPQGSVIGQTLQSEEGGQTLRPLGDQNFLVQGPLAARGASAQSSAFGETSQGFHRTLNTQPMTSLCGQTSQSQSSRNFQSQSPLSGPAFQQRGSTSGQTFQPQGSVCSSQPPSSLINSSQPQGLMIGPNDGQSQFGNSGSFQSQDILDVNQPQSLLHGQNLQQQSSLGYGATRSADMRQHEVPFDARPHLPSQQLPASAEGQVEHLHHRSPELVSSNIQHQFSGLLPAETAQNPTSNQNSYLNQFIPSQSLGRPVQETNTPALASMSDSSPQSRSASASLPSQAYGAVPGLQNTDVASENYELSRAAVALPPVQKEEVGQQDQQMDQQQQAALQQQLLQQLLQHQKMELQQATEQQLVQQQQQQQLQQLQEQMQQQQLLQQMQSSFGAVWPAMGQVGSNQTLFPNNAPAAMPGGEFMSRFLQFMMTNLPLLNGMSQSFPNNPSVGGYNAFAMQQNPFQQQMANMLAANMAPSFGSQPFAAQPFAAQPSGLETNTLASLLCQMISPASQTPSPSPQPVLSLPSDGASTNNIMQAMLQSLRGPDFGGCVAGQQLLNRLPSLFGSSSEAGSSRPGSVAGLGLELSQQNQLPCSIVEQSVQSLSEQHPDAATTEELASGAAAKTGKSGSTKVSAVKQKKRKAKGRLSAKKSRKQAKGRSASRNEDSNESGNEQGSLADVNRDESDDNGDADGDDDEAPNVNPKVYIDVADDPNCSSTKAGLAKPLSPSKRVIENGRRTSAAKGQRKKTGKDPVNQEPSEGTSGAAIRKRKGDKTDGGESSRKKKRLGSDEESDEDTAGKGKQKAQKQGERTASLRSGRGESVSVLPTSKGKSKGVESRGKAKSSSGGGGGNLAKGRGLAQEARRKDPRSSEKTSKAEGKARCPGSLKDTKKAVKSAKMKAEERASPAGSSDVDDSSNGGAPDSPGSNSSSDGVGPPSRGPQEQDGSKVSSTPSAKTLPVISMPKLSLVSVDSALKQLNKSGAAQEKTAEILGVRKCRLKQLANLLPADSESDDDRRGSYSDSSSSSGDFGPSRGHWKTKAKASRKGKSPAFKLKHRGSSTVSSSVGAPDNRGHVGPDSSQIRILKEGESQSSVGPAATTTSESAAQNAASSSYIRRGRGRPSLFQTFQSELPDAVPAASASAASGSAAVGRTSPPMPVLMKETPVRAVARVSPLAPPVVDEALREKIKHVELLDNLNEHITSQLQTVFVKLDESSDVMNVLISFKALGDNMVFQCTFCPFTDFSAKVVSDHVRRTHQGYMFAATRTPMPTGDVIYLFCRHCNFVTHDRISMWIHFEICHDVANIVYGSDVTDVTPQVTRQLVLNRDQQAIVPSFYQCVDCELLVADNRHIAHHAVKNHGEDGSCYRGCFAKARVINKPKSAPIQVTYNQLLGDEYVDQRKEVFICVRCSYIAYAEFLAITHHILSHLELRMLYSCHIEGCENREASAEAAIQHIKADHPDIGSRMLRGTVTLLSQSNSESSPLQECPLSGRKDGGKKAASHKTKVTNSAKAAGLGTEKPASTRHRGRGGNATSGESEDSLQERPPSASSTSKNTKQMTSKHPPKHN